MTIIITVILSALICLGVLLVMQWSKKATYRITRRSVSHLFQWVLLGQATVTDWRIFCDMPIHHDPFLESIRLECLSIDELHFIGDSRPPYVLNKAGMSLLKKQLELLQENPTPPA